MTDTLLSINVLKGVQRDLGLADVHLVHLGEQRFTLAHTDEERVSGTQLDKCGLHKWLVQRDRAPAAPGIYVVVPHEPDADSEPYGCDPWDFEPVDSFVRLRAGCAS